QYLASVAAPGAVGGVAQLKVANGTNVVHLSLRPAKLDKARSVSAAFVPGKALTLEAHDAAGVSYQLYLPPDALASPQTISVTPPRTAPVSSSNRPAYSCATPRT